MPLTAGTRIGTYEVVSRLGAGGMGEVYRARDLRLDREVALKVLPDSFAGDHERVARFEREAKTLAALNHPHIAQVYGVEEASLRAGPPGLPAAVSALVMELVEGEDLAQRLARGPVPIDEALAIARQLAEGLDAAHQQGIVHRDLKPANIKVRPDGTVKILDFGLAKPAAEVGAIGPTVGGAIADSPTFTSPAMLTHPGLILGTAAYMSPEQAKGKAVDKRADIWAFGVVLFEMLSGRALFAGDSVAETLGFVATREPDWRAVPHEAPASVRRLLERCLAKDPRHRLRDIGDAAFELTAAFETPASAPARRGVATWLLATATVAAAVFALAATWLWMARTAPVARPLVRFDIDAPNVRIDAHQHPVISPDGRRIAWAAAGSLWLRELDQSESRRLVAGFDPNYLTWSPSSDEVMFFAKGRLWRARVAGGDPIEIANATSVLRGVSTPGAAWLEDGRIVFAPAARGSGLLAVDSRGGSLEEFLAPPADISDFHSPSVLPGNRGLLLVEDRQLKGPDTIAILVDGELRVLLQQEGEFFESPVYSPDGFVLFERQRTARGIWALPFSLETLSATGSAFPVLPDRSWPSVSNDGTLLHTRGEAGQTGRLAIVARDGRVVRTVGDAMVALDSPRLSPDGRRVVVSHVIERGVPDASVVDLASGNSTRLTFGAGALHPRWAGDSDIVFDIGASPQLVTLGLIPAEGGGVVTSLVEDARSADISRDRRWLLFERWTPDESRWNIVGQRVDPDTLTPAGPPRRLLATRLLERTATLHPSGRFLLYRGAETEVSDLYLTRFPEARGRWQVSTGGATDPRWSAKGDSVLFVQASNLIEVPVTLEPGVSVGPPRVVLDAAAMRAFLSAFDVMPDGNTFLMVQRAQAADQPTGMVSVVLNWTEEFRRPRVAAQ